MKNKIIIFDIDATITKKNRVYLREFSNRKKAYDKQKIHEVDVSTSNYIKGDYE